MNVFINNIDSLILLPLGAYYYKKEPKIGGAILITFIAMKAIDFFRSFDKEDIQTLKVIAEYRANVIKKMEEEQANAIRSYTFTQDDYDKVVEENNTLKEFHNILLAQRAADVQEFKRLQDIERKYRTLQPEGEYKGGLMSRESITSLLTRHTSGGAPRSSRSSDKGKTN